MVGRGVTTCYKNTLSRQVTVRCVWTQLGTRFSCIVSMFLCMCVFKENKIIYLKKKVHYLLCMCMSMCGCVPVLVGVPRDQKMESRFHGAGVVGTCKTA